MKIVDVQIKRYSLPLSRELTVNNAVIKNRTGALLFLTDSDGNTACGELAPLQSLHEESLDDAIGQLAKLKDNLIGINIPAAFINFAEGIESFLPLVIFPSTATAIEMAVLNLFKQQGRFDDLKNISIPVNALLSTGTQNICESAFKLIDQGFTSIKIKVGRSILDQEIAAIKKLSEIVKGRAILRLDANRQWSLNTALEFCNQTASPQIEYIEEPLSNMNEISEFTESSPIALALDETLVEKNIEYVRQLKKIAAYILKPSLLGGFNKTAELIRQANQNNITPVISAAFTTSVSLKAYSVFAAKMKLDNCPHGLDTLKFLAEDVLQNPLTILNGKINLAQIISSNNILRPELLEDI